MFHGLDILRINSFIVHKVIGDRKLTHKQYVSQFIESLIGRADQEKFERTRQGRARTPTPSPHKGKKIRMSKNNPTSQNLIAVLRYTLPGFEVDILGDEALALVVLLWKNLCFHHVESLPRSQLDLLLCASSRIVGYAAFSNCQENVVL